MPEHLILIRHFETDAPVKGAFYGSTDLSIREGADESFDILKELFDKNQIEKIFCSPKKRCKQTADIYFPQQEKVFLEEAVEADFGEWEGKTYAEIVKDYPDVNDWASPGFSFPGGESIKSFENRIEKVLDSIYKCESPVAVLVCHAGVIRYLICNLLGIEYNRSLSFNIEPGSLTHMKLFDNRMGILSAVNVKGIFSWPA